MIPPRSTVQRYFYEWRAGLGSGSTIIMHSEHAEADDAAVGFDAVEQGHGSQRGNCDEAGTQSENNHCRILNDIISYIADRRLDGGNR